MEYLVEICNNLMKAKKLRTACVVFATVFFSICIYVTYFKNDAHDVDEKLRTNSDDQIGKLEEGIRVTPSLASDSSRVPLILGTSNFMHCLWPNLRPYSIQISNFYTRVEANAKLIEPQREKVEFKGTAEETLFHNIAINNLALMERAKRDIQPFELLMEAVGRDAFQEIREWQRSFEGAEMIAGLVDQNTGLEHGEVAQLISKQGSNTNIDRIAGLIGRVPELELLKKYGPGMIQTWNPTNRRLGHEGVGSNNRQ